MQARTYMPVKDLPPSIVAMLESVGYGSKDIQIHAAETFELGSAGGNGYRCFAAVCRLDGSRAFEVTWGSWGGSNMFSPNNAVDRADVGGPLLPAFAVVKGTIGGDRPVYATVYVHPSALAPLLPAPAAVTEKEATILAIFRSLKSSARKEYLGRLGATDAEVTALVERGFLTRNKAGATTITTAGKNAAARDYY
jgi:hypothetical protein